MKTTLFLIAFMAIATNFCSAQDTAILKRTPYKLIVQVDKKNVYEDDIGATPYVHPNNTIQIYPGETVNIEIEEVDGEIKKLTAVENVLHPDKTVKIRFQQVAKNKKHENMMLTVDNPFPYALSYQSLIFLMEQNRWVETNVLPVQAKLSGIEIWPNVIVSIALGGFQFKK